MNIDAIFARFDTMTAEHPVATDAMHYLRNVDRQSFAQMVDFIAKAVADGDIIEEKMGVAAYVLTACANFVDDASTITDDDIIRLAWITRSVLPPPEVLALMSAIGRLRRIEQIARSAETALSEDSGLVPSTLQ